MTRARAHCVICGDVTVRMESVTYYPEEKMYTFVCPHCGANNERRTDSKIGKLLIDNGARVRSSLPDPDIFAALLETDSGDEVLHHWIGGGDDDTQRTGV